MIELKNLSIGYKNQKILKNVNFTFNKNELSFIVGLNGSGKTTLLKSLLKMIPIIEGDILIDNKSIQEMNQKEMARYIAAVLPFNFSLPEIRVHEFLNLYARVDEVELYQTLKKFNLENLKQAYITKVSQGQLQQLFIMRAILQNTPYIILDEPTAHLDYLNKPKVFRILEELQQETQKGIIVITHDRAFIEQKLGKFLDLSG